MRISMKAQRRLLPVSAKGLDRKSVAATLRAVADKLEANASLPAADMLDDFEDLEEDMDLLLDYEEEDEEHT